MSCYNFFERTHLLRKDTDVVSLFAFICGVNHSNFTILKLPLRVCIYFQRPFVSSPSYNYTNWQSSSIPSNDTTNGYLLERSNSARKTLEKALEICPDVVSFIECYSSILNVYCCINNLPYSALYTGWWRRWIIGRGRKFANRRNNNWRNSNGGSCYSQNV